MLSNDISSQIYTYFGFEPTFDQKILVENFSNFIIGSSSDSIFVLNGYAGTGKTSLISAAVKALNKLKINTVLLAPTGRAAKVFAHYAGTSAYTIHRKIYRQKSLTSAAAHFDLNKNTAKNTVFIVDEASMLSNASSERDIFGSGCLLDDLVKFVNEGFNCRLVLVGDNAQLPPVGLQDSPALDRRNMEGYGQVYSADMSEVVRQQADSGILFNATLTRCMIEENIIDIPMFKTDFPEIRAINGGELIDELSDCYGKYGVEETIVITRSNKRAVRFNEGVRNSILGREEEVSTGDMVMVVKNNYHYVERDADTDIDFIANGDIAEIKRIRRYEEMYGFRFADVTLTFPDYDNYELDCKIILDTLRSEAPALSSEQNRQLFFNVEQDYMQIKTKGARYKAIKNNPHFNALQVKFAYSVTCHKAQGGQWRAVFVDKMLFGDEVITKDLMRWLYTAITRATDRLYFVNFDDRFFE